MMILLKIENSKGAFEKETYDKEEKYEYPSVRGNDLSGNIIKNQDQ